MSKAQGHPEPSMSKSALLLSPCLAWAGQSARWYDDELSGRKERNEGTEVHNLIDLYIKGKKLPSPSNSTVADKFMAAARYFDGICAETASYASEVAYAVNWETRHAKALDGVYDRKYPKDMPGYQFGTADIILYKTGGGILVGDWKTGGTEGADDQLLSLACAVAWSEGHTGPIDTACLRLDKDGCWPHIVTRYPDDLELHAQSMRRAWEDRNKAYKPSPGVHCTMLYCPHLAHCKAVGGVVSNLADESLAGGSSGFVPASSLARKFTITETPSSHEHAGWIVERITAAKRQIGYYTEAMKKYVASGGRALSGNYEWRDRGRGYRWGKL